MISHGLEHRDIESHGRSLSFKIKGPCSGMEERILNWGGGGKWGGGLQASAIGAYL